MRAASHVVAAVGILAISASLRVWHLDLVEFKNDEAGWLRLAEDMVRLGLPPLDANKRVGHGFGVASDPPSISLVDETVLEPGMILTPEPRFMSASGQRIHIEEDVVVTESGGELLSRGAEVLSIIGAGR